MKKTVQNNMILKKIGTVAFLLFVMVLPTDICGQASASAPPSGAYYNTGDMNATAPPSGANLPSQEYYNANLRGDEWDDDGGPGGVGEGDNQGVGVPVGENDLIILMCAMIYGVLKHKGIKNPATALFGAVAGQK